MVQRKTGKGILTEAWHSDSAPVDVESYFEGVLKGYDKAINDVLDREGVNTDMSESDFPHVTKGLIALRCHRLLNEIYDTLRASQRQPRHIYTQRAALLMGRLVHEYDQTLIVQEETALVSHRQAVNGSRQGGARKTTKQRDIDLAQSYLDYVKTYPDHLPQPTKGHFAKRNGLGVDAGRKAINRGLRYLGAEG